MMALAPLFAEIMPYISNFSKIKELLLELQSQTTDLNALQLALEEKMIAQEYSDATMQTDLRIIIQFLEKKNE
ncbi:MAG: hypothetical protein ACXAB4_06380 [Candidatus Hodarchaeales archaeon]|jgi:hypothetical protein